jgi:hypothetical protein
MKHRKTIIAAALLGASFWASAQTFGVHVGSVHDRDGFNNVNPGLYVRLDSGLTLGTVYNSERRQSYYAGWTWSAPLHERVEASVTLGAITGYETGVLPMAVPSLAVAVGDNTKLRVSWLQKVYKRGANAVHFSIEVGL